MTLSTAIQYAMEQAPQLIPLLEELRIRRRGNELLHQLMKLEAQKRAFENEVPQLFEVVVDQIQAIRDEMTQLNMRLQELHDGPRLLRGV